MDIVSAKRMKEIDHCAIHTYHIPSLQLMKQAALTIKAYLDENFDKQKHITILCGPGNNGGDGFAVAMLLAQSAYQNITILTNVTYEDMSTDEQFYALEVKKYPINVVFCEDMELLAQHITQSDVIVDALFGIGCTRDISGWYKSIIQFVNKSDAYIISIDMPSGIHSDHGRILQCAIQAHVTITFTCAKYGQFIYPASVACGKLLVKDIGIPKEMIGNNDTLLDDKIVQELLPQRYAHSHKGSYGKVLLIGGSVAMHGAITLCAKSLLKSGVGMLTMCIPHDIVPILSMKIEEAMILDAPSHQGYFDEGVLDLLKEKLDDYDCVVVGNGMGRNAVSKRIVSYILQQEIPCVMDGDALYECHKQMDLLRQRRADTILTPHVKEMSYLSTYTVQEIQQHPFQIAKEFVKNYPSVTLVLKDQYTIIAKKDRLYLNTIGNHSLAKGGSGDVLCGIISGLFAQSKDALSSAASGVYVHAKCADILIEEEDAKSILPSDLILVLSKVYKFLFLPLSKVKD